ncbi:MAG: hypothetical protein DME26_01670 [Verrucomicrobia bacterium]|nr:MAG: hypothetical protein DME26_01670 [Verrucomicrobiota bacterium]
MKLNRAFTLIELLVARRKR